jgi:predicted transcriptional regulator of viral defense system
MGKKTQNNYDQALLSLVRKRGIVRSRDLVEHRIPRIYLSRLCEKGMLKRMSRGLYTLPDQDFGSHEQLAEICHRVPRGVIALLSALEFHELTTQTPSFIWMAIDHKARLPRIDYPPIRFVRFSDRMLEFGVVKSKTNNATIRVYSPAKTVVDCFRFRNKIGLDIAIEALRDCRRKKAASVDEIWEAAKVCRMATVMKPYMEAVS